MDLELTKSIIELKNKKYDKNDPCFNIFYNEINSK